MTSAIAEGPDPFDAAQRAIKEMLDILGIQRVISIDDEHLDADVEFEAERVVALIQAGGLGLDEMAADPILATIFIDSDGEIVDVDTAVDIVRAGVDGDVARQLASMMARAEDQDATPGVLDPEDATDVSVRPLLEQLFSDHNYEAVTLAQWNAAGASANDAKTATLVLVDRDFSHEGLAAEAGDQVVADLIRSGGGAVRACMLTHATITEADERLLEQQVGEAQQLSAGALAVLSKTGLRDEPVKFAAKFRRMLLLEHLSVLRGILGDALDAGLAASRARLDSLDEFELISMVGSAIEEGAHEPEHILRLLQAESRRAMQEAVRPDGQTMDVLHPLHRALDVDFKPLGLDEASDVAAIEVAEMYDDGAFLARTVQSTEPGDIFQIASSAEILGGRSPVGKHHLVLLAQPCDVVVRSTGHRGVNVPPHMVLARIHSLKKVDSSQISRRENVLLSTFPAEPPDARLVKLAEVVHVPALALDLCVFDVDGYSRMTLGDPVPPKASWAWTMRHAKLQERLKEILEAAEALDLDNLDAEQAAAVTSGLTGCLPVPGLSSKLTVSAHISVKEKKLAFGLRRIARLNDAATRSLLIQATHHQGRPADEARLIGLPLSADRKRAREAQQTDGD